MDGREAITNPLCVALDASRREDVERLADLTEPHVGLYKVGVTAYAANGPRLATELATRKPVFLDLKLHDIPAQVAGALSAVAELGVRFVTVHASGGPAMIQAAVDGARERVDVLAVTVLSSLDDELLDIIGVSGPTEAQVLRLADMSLAAGAAGIVCSPREVSAIRSRFGESNDGGPVLVVPGIRPDGAGPDDQRRTMPPEAALEAGADVIVVGRPITGAADPAAAARSVFEALHRHSEQEASS
jgi:orotidine-5'-phosphate decarboxylase